MGWLNTFTNERAGAPSIMLVPWFWQNESAQLRKPSEQVLRQAQDERQVIDFVRGEPFDELRTGLSNHTENQLVSLIHGTRKDDFPDST